MSNNTSNVSTPNKKKAFDASALAVLGVLFIAVILLTSFLFRGWRIDLTENRLYTIAPGTKNVVSNLDEPINLYFFFSQEASQSQPQVRAYAQRVRELLEEMAQRSKGKLRLSAIDPAPFSEEEDRAAQYGLTAAPVGQGNQQLYFGLAGTNSTDGKQVIPFFQYDKEEFLEYDVASMIYKLAHPKNPTIGLLTSLPMDASFDQMTGQMRQGWAITSQLRELYNIKTLQPTLTSIDKDVDVLMLVHPKNLSQEALYAIDQYVMRGGKLLAFVDPHAEQDQSSNPAHAGMPNMSGDGNRASTLGPLFTAWGIDYDMTKVVGDAELALTVAMRQGQAPSRHLGVVSMNKNVINRKDVITSTLDSINLLATGSIKQHVDESKKTDIQFEPLLTSTKQAALLDASKFQFLDDPRTLFEGFAPTGEQYTIAARITGKLPSAFPTASKGGSDNKLVDALKGDVDFLKESTDTANVVIVADTDLLADMMWVRTQNVFGQRYAVAWANNGDFVANILDNLAGSSDLISIRGRQSFFRPFTKVEELRQLADKQLRDKEQELNKQLQETESKLTQLQATRSDKGSMTLSPEQEQELQRFQQERSRFRKELREVKRSLDVGIDRLGWWIKVINIGLIPLILIAAAIVVTLRRRRRLQASRLVNMSAPSTAGAQP
jgi:ABC-type uncharacterized transport system involved in gliding motility auxiliary subunit